MAEQIQEVFWLTSADRQQLLYVSQAFEAIWGRPVESLYAYPGGHVNLILDSIHPSDRDQVVAAFASNFPNNFQSEYKQEYRIVRPDGSIRWVRSRSFPVQNPFGETWGIAGLSEDITERKQAKDILHQREQEFRALVELSPDIISRFDRELRYIYVNPAIKLATGMLPQEFLGKTNRELGMPQAVLSLWEQSLQKVFQSGETDEHEFSFLTPTGLKYYQSRLVPELAADGSVKFVLAICRDLTKNKQTEEALRESEERFRTVFKSAPMGMVLANSKGMFLQTNQAFQEIFGYTETELQNLSFIELTHPADRAENVKVFQELFLGKRTHFSLAKRCFRKDGSLVWVNVSVSAVGDANGLPQYAIGIIQDISDRKQAELALQQAHDELEKRVAERTAELAKANTLLQQEIAERKQAQKALKAQKEFLQTVIDGHPNAIVVKDTLGKYVLTNQAFTDFFEITVEECSSKTVADFHFNQAEVEQYQREDQEVLSLLQEQVTSEKAVTTPTGEVRYFQAIKKYLLSPDGQTPLVLGVGTDITELKQVEEALRESEQRYRLLIERMNDGVIVSNENDLISYVNEKFSEMLGYSPSEIIGHSLLEFLDEANQKIVQEQKSRHRNRRGENGSYELGLRRKDGFMLLTLMSWSSILGTEGGFKGSFGVITDITALKTVESELQQAKEQLRAVLDAVPGCVSWISSQGRYLGVNQHLAQSCNLSPDAFVGKELGFLKNSPEFVQFMAQFLKSSAQTDRQVIETQANGSTRNYLIAAQKYNQGASAVSVGIDITESIQAQEALKTQKEFLQTVLDTNPNLIWVKDRADRVVLANRACADFFETTVEDMLGLTDYDLPSNPVDVEVCIAQDKEVLATLQEKFIPEETFPTPRGEVRWFQTIKKPIFSSDGQVCQILGVSTDITDRKLAEQQRRESEEQLRLALEAARMGFWDWNLQTGKITWSNNFKQLFGWSSTPEEGTYKSFLEIIHPEDRDRLQSCTQCCIETGENCDIEFRIIWPDGSIHWIESKGQVFYDATGTPVRTTGINLDITERKQAEELQRQTQARLRRLVEANLIGVIFADFSGNITEANDTFLNMVGYTREDLRAGKVRWLDMTPPEYAEDDAQARAQLRLTGVCTPHEKEYIRKDGSRVPILTGSALLEGSKQDCVSFVVDLTWHKQAETQIQASLREKEVLLQEIHHRVKNNLQVICSLLDLQSQDIEEPATQEMFRESQNRVKSMALVHEKLYQSKDFASINFAEYIENLISYLFQVYRMNANNITLELEIDEVSLNIDQAIPCGLIISELVSNALKHAFPNSQKGTITITLYSNLNNQITLIIKDNGVGFNTNFDFNSLNSLGLKLVNVLIHQLEGTLEIDYSAGTEFKIKFLGHIC